MLRILGEAVGRHYFMFTYKHTHTHTNGIMSHKVTIFFPRAINILTKENPEPNMRNLP